MVRTIKLLFTVLFVASIFTACEKEYSAENGLLPGSGIPGGGGGGGGGATGCKSCTYQPWCDGSVYTYIDTSGGSATPSTSTLDIVADTTIDGKTYSKTLSEGNFSYHNCTGGVTSLIALQPNPLGGSSIRVNTTILKENLPVGSTWTEVNPTGAGIDNTYDYEIIAKGVSRTVLGVTYSDVIQVHQTLSVDIPIFGPLPVSETDYYFARNVGLIESLIIDGTLGTQVLHRVLQSYTIP